MGVEQSIVDSTEFRLANTACRIVIICSKSGEDCLSELSNLPAEARILAVGNNLEEIKKDGPYFSEANVILNITGNAKTLAEILNEMSFVRWVHSITSGVEQILIPEIVDNPEIVLTNAKGVFSSSLAEYVLGACFYFAKDIPRFLEQQRNKVWKKFVVGELKGATMGIIGYGDIGFHCAKLAKAYGMKVLALRRFPNLSNNDGLCDETYGTDQLNEVIQQSDYLVVALPLTNETFHFIKQENLKFAKKNQIIINIGRGALIDEDALTEALKDGTVAGAALDVFTVEPLPETSELWELKNVLISSHNADINKHESIRLFTENCKKYVNGEELNCIVNKSAGY